MELVVGRLPDDQPPSGKSTGTRTRPAAFCPFTTDGLKRHFLAAAIAARSRSRLRLDLSTDTSTTLPLASTSMIRITVPSMPARTAEGGDRGGFMFFDEINTQDPMFWGGAGGGRRGGRRRGG